MKFMSPPTHLGNMAFFHYPVVTFGENIFFSILGDAFLGHPVYQSDIPNELKEVRKGKTAVWFDE